MISSKKVVVQGCSFLSDGILTSASVTAFQYKSPVPMDQCR